MTYRAISLLLLLACGTNAPRPKTFGGDRPVDLQVPDGFDASKHYPLVLILHGYSATGFLQQAYFNMMHLPGAFVLAPDGLTDSMGHQFWNADPACCDFDHKNPDDVGYLGGLLDEVAAAWPVDPHQVLVIGHSNGGYMAYRLACDRADVITDITVLAGVAASTACAPQKPVDVLHLHGTLDDMVPFADAAPSVAKWAGYDGCGQTRTAGAPLDLDVSLAGAETQTATADGCPAGVAVEFWTIQGAGHVPSFNASFEPSVWQWFTTHPR